MIYPRIPPKPFFPNMSFHFHVSGSFSLLSSIELLWQLTSGYISEERFLSFLAPLTTRSSLARGEALRAALPLVLGYQWLILCRFPQLLESVDAGAMSHSKQCFTPFRPILYVLRDFLFGTVIRSLVNLDMHILDETRR